MKETVLKPVSLLLLSTVLLGACAPVTRTTRVYEEPRRVSTPYIERGTVQRIEVVETHQNVGPGGAILGAVVGGVVGNQVGRGSGRAAATAIGAVGGAVVGNHIERREAAANSDTYYKVFVRLDNGQRRRFECNHIGNTQVGDRVRLHDGEFSCA